MIGSARHFSRGTVTAIGRERRPAGCRRARSCVRDLGVVDRPRLGSVHDLRRALALAATLFVAAGLGLIAAGLITSRRRRFVGGLSVVAGLVWFAPAWEGWEGGPALPRAAAMLAAPMVLPVLVHLVLVAVMPTLSRSALVVIIATYALVGLPAVLVALVRDPYLDPHCFADCTTRLFVVSARPSSPAL